jgi:hypothetical protein
MCEDFVQKFDNKRTDCTPFHASFFTREFFTKNYTTVFPHPPYFSLFPRLKMKLKGRHFDTIEAIEAESQAVLNSLTEHDFQGAFKNGKSAGNGAYSWKGSTFMVMVVRRPKVSFGPKWQLQSRKLWLALCIYVTL